MKNNVKVQVICVTYNQKNYIKEALDGFLMQKTNFKFEVLVGDDCSTDGTSDIVAKYAEKYPEIIKHIRRPKNLGALTNFMDLCEQITAPYAAFCDGDDYWTHENKLQKQFDFMEANEDVNFCAHKTFVKYNNECSTYSFHANLKEPFIIPYKLPYEKKITLNEIIMDLPQTSSFFIRWQNIVFPQWCYEGIAADYTMACLNLGDKYAYILKDKMSVYRKVESGVVYSDGDIYKHFLETRKNYFHILLGIADYFKNNYNSFGLKKIEARLWQEIINYTNSMIKTDRFDLLLDLKNEYPDIYEKVKGLLSEYRFRLQQINILGLKRANLLREKSTLRTIKPLIKIIYGIKKLLKTAGKISNNILSFSAYWIFALIPKKKNLWIFSGFMRKNYMDNTKYLYEYIVKNHPEIKVLWITSSKEILNRLKEKGLPVAKTNTLMGIFSTIRAEIAFSDHFRMSDYKNIYGYNARTKFVNLWHGVGLKDMRPVNGKLKNTTITGVKLSNDIIISKEDKLSEKIKKIFKYPFVAPFREMFEKYFMIVCPGQQFIDYSATPWHIPQKAHFLCGYPRTVHLKEDLSVQNRPKIIYAPTYRWKKEHENELVQNFLDSVDDINNLLESVDGTFVLRLHPHTWRNYENSIIPVMSKYPRFSISKEKDIYKELAEYSLMITDYSSIAYDFLITQKPIIFLAFDYKSCCTEDYNFQMDYKQYCPGDITYSWLETIEAIKKSIENPHYNRELREKISKIFTPAEYNNENNSKNITEELKRRLNIKDKR